jgi:aspartyl-tRNA(Asn)/glutamyl-tRNA(Gln) amidotransferase subunit A
MTHPQDMSLREQARAVGSGELDPEKLLTATLERIEERNSALRAVAATFPRESMAMLASAPRGRLYGVPVTMKDMYSLPWRGYRNGTVRELGRPSASGAFRRLRDVGAVVVGIDNQHELGLGSTGLVSAYGVSANPWNHAHLAGGSSGGSAAAVTAKMVGGAIGSDSGGSTRLPAAWCGAVGLKVTYGSLPYDGYNGANSSFSGPGVLARDSADARLLLEALLARPLPVDDVRTVRVGLVRRPYWEDVDREVSESCENALADVGLQQRELALPLAELGPSLLTVRAMAEFGASPPLDLLPQLNPMTRALIHYSALQPAWRLTRADRVRAGLRRGLAAIFADCDVLAWPTSPGPAPAIDSPVFSLPSGPQPVDRANVRQTVLANVTGVPALSVPVALHQTGLPIGLQLLAPWGEEALLLNVAQRIEDAVGRTWRPGQK